MIWYLQEAGVGPHRQVEARGVGDQQDVAVDVDGGPRGAEVQGEDVAGLARGHQHRLTEVLHLWGRKRREKNNKAHIEMGRAKHQRAGKEGKWRRDAQQEG